MTKLSIIYYSSYGTAHEMASRLAATAESQGAEVRLRRVRETAPDEVVQAVEGWAAQAASVADQPVAEPEDLAWADAVIMGGFYGDLRNPVATSRAQRHNGFATGLTLDIGTHTLDLGAQPSPRALHACTILYDNSFFVCGGAASVPSTASSVVPALQSNFTVREF